MQADGFAASSGGGTTLAPAVDSDALDIDAPHAGAADGVDAGIDDFDGPDEELLTAPAVVAVVVAHDPGPWFAEALTALAEQDYPSLSVLVIDAASEEPVAPLVATVLPAAYVRRIDTNPGFGPAANEVLEVVEGAAFYLLCHDDVALAPDAVRAMVEEAYRSNAGVVGPKLVAWDDPTQLLQVGIFVDKTGYPLPDVERGELDQEQHDAVRDVFCVPGAATLVRADLFATLGGFDRGIDLLGEDLDLCWRAQVVGARVLVAPAAVARHLEALGERTGLDEDDRRRLSLRHRLRTMLTCYGRFHRARVLPQYALLAVGEVLYAVLAGRRKLAADIVGSWTSNWRHRGEVTAARERLAEVRAIPDSEVRRLQVRGSARIIAFLRGQLGRGADDRVKALTRSAGDLAGSLRSGPLRITAVAWGGIALILLVGSRHYVFGAPPSLVDLPELPSRPWPLLAEWLSGWRSAGIGSESPAPTAYGLLGLSSTALLGSTAILRKLLVVVPLALGPIGAARLARPFGGRRASIVAAIVFAGIPLPYNALANGRWGGLVAWSATPWVLARLARAGGIEPFDSMPQLRDNRAVLGLGLLTALLAAVLPIAILMPLVLAATLGIGGLIAGRARGTGSMLWLAGAATIVAVGLHLPWALDFILPGATWAPMGGVRSAVAPLDIGEILRFETGPIGAPPLGWLFLVAAVLPLLIGQRWRLQWAVRFWVLALAGFALAVVAGTSWCPVSLGPPELLLAPAAAGLAVAVALGAVAFQVDLPGYRFGWRQAASVGAAAAVVAGLLPVLGGAVGGRWHAPEQGVNAVLTFLDSEQSELGAFRTMWIGDPVVLPAGHWELSDGVGWATTDDGLPTALDRWVGSPDGTTELLADAVARADGGQTSRLGRMLAPFGVRYVVVVEADRPITNDPHPAPRGLIDALGRQLDLAEIEVDPGLRVFRNTAWFSSRASLPGGVPDEAASALAGRVDLSEDAVPVLADRDGYTRFQGELRTGDVWQSVSSSPNWHLSAAGDSAASRKGFGFGNAFTVDNAGAGTLSYRTPLYRLLLSGIQALLWAAAVVVLLRARRAAAGAVVS